MSAVNPLAVMLFFVKKNLALGKLPELTPEQAFYPQSRRLRIKSQKKTVRSD